MLHEFRPNGSRFVVERLIHELAGALRDAGPGDWVTPIAGLIAARLSPQAHGDFPRWSAALEALPVVRPSGVNLQSAAVTVTGGEASSALIGEALARLHPWRKGPYAVHGVSIDSEWRSDAKWERLRAHIEDLRGRVVLDVGCGNGYHCWRMAGEGARLAVGIDPSALYVMQYLALRHFIPGPPVWVLPLAIANLPHALSGFDTVFSMGMLYHRRSPIDHLLGLKSLLRGGGQLVLETLVIDGDADQLLIPEGRYAKMRNVWFIPSVPMLCRWLERTGFERPSVIDVSATSGAEQRSTEWMRFESLADFLDPVNRRLTVEGHPAPRRCVVTATRPRTA